ANIPNTMNVVVTSVVRTGRRIQSSDKPISESCLRLARGNPRPLGDLQMTLGHHHLAAFKPALDHGLRIDDPSHLDGHHPGEDRPGSAAAERTSHRPELIE